MAFERGGPALPSRAVAALSSADSAAAADGRARTIVAVGILGTGRIVGVAGAGGRYGNHTTSRTTSRAGCTAITGRRAARGPAPSVKMCGFFAADVSASGLLRAVRGRHGVVAPAILFVLVPPGIAQRAGSRSELSSAASGGVSTPASSIATGVAAAAVMSLPVVYLPRSREDRTYPPRRRRADGFRCFRFPPFLPVLGGGVEGASCVAGRTPR